MLALPPALCKRLPRARTSFARGPVSDKPRSDLTSGSSYRAASDRTAASTVRASDLLASGERPNSLSRKLMSESPYTDATRRSPSFSPAVPNGSTNSVQETGLEGRISWQKTFRLLLQAGYPTADGRRNSDHAFCSGDGSRGDRS